MIYESILIHTHIHQCTHNVGLPPDLRAVAAVVVVAALIGLAVVLVVFWQR